MQRVTPGQTLMLSAVLRAAARSHPSVEVVSRLEHGGLHRTTYAAIERRCRRLARVLARLGVVPGARVGILAWDGARALEVFYAAAGIGAVAHPIDPRLPPHLVAEALAAAEDVVLFADAALADVVAGIAPPVRASLARVVVLCEEAEMPVLPLPVAMGLHCYEPLLASEGEDHEWAVFDEATTAALCETEGRRGHRRALPASHRALLLQALAANQPDGLGVRAVDRVLACAVLQSFGAWGLGLIAPMAGAALLLPGRHTDGLGLFDLADRERATLAVGVPAPWQGLLAEAEAAGAAPAALRRVVCTGDAVPTALRLGLARLGVDVAQVWGLAEAGPACTFAAPTAATADLVGDAAERLRLSHGRLPFGLEVKLLGGDGQELPSDGMAVGAVFVRGPLVVAATDRHGTPALDAEGWLDTGDMASLDGDGFLRLFDRAGDAIRSGGEWISAVLLERAAAAHPDVAEATCIGAPHPKWQERPLLLLVPRLGTTLDLAQVRRLCEQLLPAWWVPEAMLAVAALPRTATGRVDKAALRTRHAGHFADPSRQQHSRA